MKRQVKVGLFVIFGLVLTMAGVALIGNATQLWEPRFEYHTAFADVAGLKPGAPIRMGGLDIGQVTGVDTGADLHDTRVFVTLSITKKEASRIRADTVAHIVNKGLLGDRMIELSVGSPDAALLDKDKLIASEEPADMFAAANKLAQQTQETIAKLAPLAQALGDPKFAADIKGSAEDVHDLLDSIVHGNGTAHRLFYDHQDAEQLSALLVSLRSTSAHLDATLADVEDITKHVKEGPGISHAIIYDGEMSKNAAGTLDELHQDFKAIREGNGLAHTVLYGDEGTQHVMANINAMTDDLRVIVSGVRQGKGTLGALLVDPTVYEDLRAAIGNVERNEVLRALVRYSIKADEKKADVKVEGK
jgi:phospholipid/cholesterol/gamma-HCH transport system substrate-binding protein